MSSKKKTPASFDIDSLIRDETEMLAGYKNALTKPVKLMSKEFKPKQKKSKVTPIASKDVIISVDHLRTSNQTQPGHESINPDQELIDKNGSKSQDGDEALKKLD